MKKLPIGISTLANFIADGYVYVDKTPYVQMMADRGKYYFLSRPRRFGKSLLVDTLHQLFAGNETLFRGLHIHPHWDWAVQYPVISISFAEGLLESRAALERRIQQILELNQEQLGVSCRHHQDPAACFGELIRNAKAKYGRDVVVLVDEYDKPILDNITHPEVAADMRNGLRDLYSVIKGQDANIRFAFLTGVSKFSKVSLFSGLNNLEDITLDPRYSALCGYTQTELEYHFAEHLQGADMAMVRSWYNGYNWLGESVYNPFDVLLFIAKGKEFLPYWFETATPSFLVHILRKRPFYLPDLEAVRMDYKALGDFDVDRIHLETLLFQTGYLTIKEKIVDVPGSLPEYALTYPNNEVRYSLMGYLLDNYLTDTRPERSAIRQALIRNDFAALERHFRALFDNIAHQNYTNNPIASYEGYYASVMYAFLCSLSLDTRAEESSNKGRVDMTLRLPFINEAKRVYIFEFKLVDGAEGDGGALVQIKQQDYAAPYRDGQHCIFLVGMEFSAQVRNFVRFEWEEDGLQG
ncbi:ATP-binding protein [Thiothrix nivea]|uniref:AAA-ATPase-like protein n=1 Tax=Thiothrix nivea (strain ATCC 35100 / DSM 5205 / JP2) TaxID=870187 RepID=A0A656HE19_THINJ|nr:ATP-binding protein [Thiothrix nivea]EIJ34603.1 AAA-ATPase-like protein [Thiothrix nivea DSM 5205]